MDDVSQVNSCGLRIGKPGERPHCIGSSLQLYMLPSVFIDFGYFFMYVLDVIIQYDLRLSTRL